MDFRRAGKTNRRWPDELFDWKNVMDVGESRFGRGQWSVTRFVVVAAALMMVGCTVISATAAVGSAAVSAATTAGSAAVSVASTAVETTYSVTKAVVTSGQDAAP